LPDYTGSNEGVKHHAVAKKSPPFALLRDRRWHYTMFDNSVHYRYALVGLGAFHIWVAFGFMPDPTNPIRIEICPIT
jgi:hypothetical protein